MVASKRIPLSTSRYLLGLEQSIQCCLLLPHTLDNLFIREGNMNGHSFRQYYSIYPAIQE